MLFIAIIFALLCHQSSCYFQKSVCTSLAFGKCVVGTHCGITDTGAYTCLPCPAGKYLHKLLYETRRLCITI